MQSFTVLKAETCHEQTWSIPGSASCWDHAKVHSPLNTDLARRCWEQPQRTSARNHDIGRRVTTASHHTRRRSLEKKEWTVPPSSHRRQRQDEIVCETSLRHCCSVQRSCMWTLTGNFLYWITKRLAWTAGWRSRWR